MSHDCIIGEQAFQRLQRPAKIEKQRASALPFAAPRVQAVLSALVLFRLLPRGFSNRDLRAHLAELEGKRVEEVTPGRMTYDLRRLRLHGIIERIPKSHRYRLTDSGLRTALFFTRAYNRLLRPGIVAAIPDEHAHDPSLRASFRQLEATMDRVCERARLAA